MKRILIPGLILLVGLVIMFGLIASRRKPVQAATVFPGVLVETMTALADTHHAVISGTGTVRARQEIALAPQVAGRIDWVADNFESGGVFHRGDILCRIEAIDYELAVEQARARVAQSEYQLAVERAQADIARKEWERMQESGAQTNGTPESLVLREPQLKQAEANHASALAALRQAHLALERTRVRAPFDGRVKREMADIGQTVTPSQPIATLFSTGSAEIEVGIPVDELLWLEEGNSSAQVSLNAGGQWYHWQGTVDRTLGVIDSIGRLARVVVRVDDPYAARSDGGPELAVGSFVSVEISGRRVPNVTPMPLFALRSNNIVWIARADSTLELREVTAVFHSPDSVFVGSEVKSGERIVLSGINGAADGLKLRLTEALR
ncbi:MAG: efflux RND transporter periplasmic adaptor subunit [bacterium]|nr:efflux RND transporter periplasmic adaptor subunit [bacterium]